jgi:hypothetical protein
VALSAAIGLLAKGRLDALEAERASWSETRSVLVAAAPMDPGDRLQVERVELPERAIPDAAVSELASDARLHQRVGRGEIIVAADLVSGVGPALHANDGMIVVGIIDSLSPNAAIGLSVQVSSEGIVLADDATIVGLDGEVIFVAVPERNAPVVAAAAQSGFASILFVP